MTTPNVHPDEIARFEKLAARWWGEPGCDATCLEGQVAPASARAWMAGQVLRTRDGSPPDRGHSP